MSTHSIQGSAVGAFCEHCEGYHVAPCIMRDGFRKPTCPECGSDNSFPSDTQPGRRTCLACAAWFAAPNQGPTGQTVQSALRRDEWVQGRTADGNAYMTGAGEVAVMDTALGETALVNSRHAVAALCLHSQPFGFTHEDVVMLRQVQIADYRDEWRRAFDSLAERIEALLPPK